MIEFTLENGETATMQFAETESSSTGGRPGTHRGVGRSNNEIVQAPRRFDEAVKCIAPIGNALLSSLKNIDKPDEINLEFAISFNGKAGVVFSSIESNASFKVSIKWKNNH
jgi:hypothetical protein